MYICYVDEAGCTGALPSPSSPIQPVFLLVGVALQQSRLHALTRDFLTLKRELFPGFIRPGSAVLDQIVMEIKGGEIRRQIRSNSRNERRHAVRFLERTTRLLEQHDGRIFGRLYVKGIGEPINSASIYTFSVQDICTHFQRFLEQNAESGVVIADSRRKGENARVAHSVFTQKFKALGDPYDRILEMPVFGHSENHAGLQIADAVVSGLLFPMATFAYCTGYVNSVHVHPNFGEVRRRFGNRLKALQYRYNQDAKWRGGIAVSDGLAK